MEQALEPHVPGQPADAVEWRAWQHVRPRGSAERRAWRVAAQRWCSATLMAVPRLRLSCVSCVLCVSCVYVVGASHGARYKYRRVSEWSARARDPAGPARLRRVPGCTVRGTARRRWTFSTRHGLLGFSPLSSPSRHAAGRATPRPQPTADRRRCTFVGLLLGRNAQRGTPSPPALISSRARLRPLGFRSRLHR